MSQEKMWGSESFWGLGYDWDPDLAEKLLAQAAEDEAQEPIGR